MVRAMKALMRLVLLSSLVVCGALGRSAGHTSGVVNVQAPYEDGRPQATLRMEAQDYGVVLRHGGAPLECDKYGARDVWIFEAGGKYYLHYDAAGPKGWLCALATSKDLIHWTKHGAVLDLGKPGSDDSQSASYGTTFFDGSAWQMFYMGTPHASPPPDRLPRFPYLTLKARSASPMGPWQKQPEVVPFRPQPGTYYSVTASPGYIVKYGGEYLQFFSAAVHEDGPPKRIRRTIGIARSKDLDGTWSIDPQPIVPLDEQIENTSLYYEKAGKTWYLFTDHIGIKNGYEYTDAIWVYWSQDLNEWDTAKKAVVLDSRNCKWSPYVVGLPSVIKVGNRLALFYDGLEGDQISHMGRDVGLAFLPLPLQAPK